MMAFIRRIFGWLLGGVTGLFGRSWAVELAKWTAGKVILTAFCTIGIYILCNNVLVWAVTKIIAETSAQLGNQGSLQNAVIQLSGLGAYIADKFRLVPSFAIVVTGLSIRAIRQFLPF